MDLKLLAMTFASVFVAELGDKTQLATLGFAASNPSQKLAVFVGSSVALATTSAIGVLAGGVVSRHVGPRPLALSAGALFIAIGAFTLWRGLRMH